MKIPRWVLAAVSSAALAVTPTTAQAAAPNFTDQASASVPNAIDQAGPSASRRAGWPRGETGRADAGQPQPPTQGLCRPGTPPDAPPTTVHFDGNPLLGPAVLPGVPPVGPLLTGYRRIGGLTVTGFLQQYGNATRTGYVYPPASGFVLGPDGRPIKNQQTLLPGYRLDRFGFPGGAFLAPLGTPFSARSLPPSNLNTPSDAPLANYHVYCVVSPFTVDSGPIAPWFAQSGLGTQFQLNPAYLPQAGASLSITWLLQHGYLVEEDLTAAACAVPLQRGYAPAVC
ncbi:TNT domain-containing protein [Micromonospora sp. NPDC002296]|uniref:TNT domain-containing protein n=1 Tax=Micromonospora sp. NPDC002296 TaxID=3154271 RepID=UPI00332D34E3